MDLLREFEGAQVQILSSRIMKPIDICIGLFIAFEKTAGSGLVAKINSEPAYSDVLFNSVIVSFPLIYSPLA